MNRDIKAGDVVRLKSGGPRMTVNAVIEEHYNKQVYCYWFDRSKHLESGTFYPEALRVVKANTSA